MNTQFCQNCGCATAHSENDTSHFIHFLLTLFTGFWAILWVYCYLANGRKANKCMQCGCKNA